MADAYEAGYNDVITALKGGNASASNPQTRQRQPAQQGGTHTNQYTFAAEADTTCAAPRTKRTVKCAYCGRPHFAGRCHIYKTIAMRMKRLRQMNHCFLCLRGGHWTEACPHKADVLCKSCTSSYPHHISLCRVYMGYRPNRPADPVNKPSPDGGSEAIRSSQHKTVNWQENRRDLADNTVRFSSAPNSPQDNSKDDRTMQSGKKKKNKTKGTPSSGRGGTHRPTTASAAESIPPQDVQAWNSTGLLPGHQCLLQTDRCPTQTTCPQFTDDDFARLRQENDQAWLAELRASEEISSIETQSRVSDGDMYDPGREYDEDWGEYPETSGYAVSTSSPPDQQAVILECVKAIAVNTRTGASREVIVFFDSGSTASYVSTELALALDLPQHEKRTLQVNTFAATTTTTLEGFSTSLVLRTARGRSISLDATAADNIVRSVRTAFVTNEDIPRLRQNNCALISTRETPDLLIGQDLVHLFERRHEKRLPNGCYVVQTVLGPMVGGAGQVTTTVPRDAKTTTAADIAGGHGTLCQWPSMSPVDILDRSPSTTRRDPQSASSMTGQHRLPPDPALAHSANKGVRTTEEPHSAFLCGLAEKTDDELLGDFSYLENAGIGTNEMKPDDQTAADMLKTMHLREKDGRYKVPLLFRTATGAPPSNEALPTNAPLAKGRAISTRNSLLKAPQKLRNYDEIVKDYEKKEFIGRAPRFTPYPKHCLSHHPVFKETSTTTATRPVFDASAHLPGRPDPAPKSLPDHHHHIGKAFLQMSVLDSHRDCLRFYWFKDPFAEPTEDNIIECRFNRVPFGLKSSPYLLAGVIKMHLEQEGTPLALEMLKNCYVDNVLLMADNVNEALQKYRDSKATFAKIQMPLREYASNNAQFNHAIDPAD
ncbi:Pao retrotransposon peptidase family protein [Aphelenchoides avenae]|nr:Pao retrotransposon peptidase family protein [Aphelenchus avenae]